MPALFVLGAFWIGLSFIVGLVADAKGRHGATFFLLSLLVSPVLAGLLLTGLVLRAGGKEKASVEEKPKVLLVRCTECGEVATEPTEVCPRCGEEMPEVPSEEELNRAKKPSSSPVGRMSGIGLLFSVALTLFFALVGLSLSLYSEWLPRAGGLFGGVGVGALFAFGAKRLFPRHVAK